MYQIFIVDDEEKTRKGLAEYFAREHSGDMKIVGEAENGAEALKRIETLLPDVVITDIKMPVMDGITLAKKLRKTQPQMKIIFISGYDDTDYLKSALEVEAIDYIFKPVDFAELDRVVLHALNLVNKENKIKKNMIDLDMKLRKSMPLLRDKFFVNLVRGGYSDESMILKQVDFLSLTIYENSAYCIMIAEIDDYVFKCAEMTERERQGLSFGIMNVFAEIVEKYMQGYVFENNQGEFVALLEIRGGDYNDKIYPIADAFKKSIREYLGFELSIGIGNGVNTLMEVSKSYHMASRALKHKLFLGKSNIIAIDSIEDPGSDQVFLLGEEAESVENLLIGGNLEALEAYIADIFKKMYEAKSTKLMCQMNLINLIARVQQAAMRMGVAFPEEDSATVLIEKLCQMDTLDSMHEAVADFVKKTGGAIISIRETKSSNAVEEVKRIIRQRYSENITIDELAEMVYLTPTYLCVLFKQETNLTINDYRTVVRINKAKELLCDLKNKIYDISYAVGYENPSYFSLQFKKFTGMVPKEYRDTLL